MKKFLLAIFLLIVAGALFVWLIKAPLIASYLTEKMHVPVTIGNLSISPSQAVITHFKINNPRGFKARTALRADEVQVDYGWKKLFSNPVEIDQIEVRDVFLSIELSNPTGSQNNWTAIASRLPKQDEGHPNRELLIHKLILTNLTVEIIGLGPMQTKKIGRLEFDEIDSREGFPTKALIQAIFQGAGVQDYLKGIFELVPQTLFQKLLSP